MLKSIQSFRADMSSEQLHEACKALRAEPDLLQRYKLGRSLVPIAAEIGLIPRDSARSFLASEGISLLAAVNFVGNIAETLPKFVANLEALQRANANIQYSGRPIDIESCRRNHLLLARTLDEARRRVPQAFQGLAA